MIDAIDKQILTILQKNARTSNAEIARQVGMAASAVLERIRKMEEQGTILGYETRINPRDLDLNLLAFMFVRTDEGVGTVQTAEILATIPEVQEVHHITGQDCYLVKLRVANTEILGNLLREKIGQIKTVRSTSTTIVLGSSKETLKLVIEPI
jgi:Lrp/AsnC family leucine-responsive transcriptional regulator